MSRTKKDQALIKELSAMVDRLDRRLQAKLNELANCHRMLEIATENWSDDERQSLSIRVHNEQYLTTLENERNLKSNDQNAMSKD